MDENALLTVILATHDALKSLSSLKSLTNLQSQKAKLQSFLDISSEYYGLHKYSIQKIEQKTMQKIIQFETTYKQKLETGTKLLKKSCQISQNQRKTAQETLHWLKQNPNYRTSLFQLSQILENIRQGYCNQLQLINKKWNQICLALLRKESGIEDKLKVCMLHVSYQSFVEEGLLRGWDQIIVGLQAKRYN